MLLFVHLFRRARRAASAGRERAQATAEYALVLLGVAAVALLVVAWAGGTNKIGKLLDAVLDSIIDKI